MIKSITIRDVASYDHTGEAEKDEATASGGRLVFAESERL